MSPNRVGLHEAIEQLKEEAPTVEQRARATEALLAQGRSAFRLRAVAVGVGVCVLMGSLLLYPSRKTSSLAWGDVLHNTESAVSWHTVEHDSQPDSSGESWRSGDNFASFSRNKKGEVIFETRSDPHSMYVYLMRLNYTEDLPNQYGYATLLDKPPGLKKFTPAPNTISHFLSTKNTKLISQQTVEVNGKSLERYEVNSWGKSLNTVDVDPLTKRIVEIQWKGGSTSFDYPDSIDPAVFSWKSRVTKDVWVMDRRGEKWPPVYKMNPPILTRGPIKLLGVYLQPGGYLSVAWQGPMLNKHGFSRFKVLGVRTGKPWGPMGSYDGVWKPNGPASKREISVQVPLLDKIGDHVSFQIPTATTNVLFKDVPVKIPFKKLPGKC